MSGRAVEAAGDCSTLLLDKTGTITYGNRMADEILPVGGVDEAALAEAVLLNVLNVMHLDNPHTAILSAVIYNALIIPALIPLALRGVKFRPRDGAAILRHNALIYGIGGILAPFIFIKLIDLLLSAIGLH
jgi:potassium-transporting ATPase ATP-binding subunit